MLIRLTLLRREDSCSARSTTGLPTRIPLDGSVNESNCFSNRIRFNNVSVRIIDFYDLLYSDGKKMVTGNDQSPHDLVGLFI